MWTVLIACLMTGCEILRPQIQFCVLLQTCRGPSCEHSVCHPPRNEKQGGGDVRSRETQGQHAEQTCRCLLSLVKPCLVRKELLYKLVIKGKRYLIWD